MLFTTILLPLFLWLRLHCNCIKLSQVINNNGTIQLVRAESGKQSFLVVNNSTRYRLSHNILKRISKYFDLNILPNEVVWAMPLDTDHVSDDRRYPKSKKWWEFIGKRHRDDLGKIDFIKLLQQLVPLEFRSNIAINIGAQDGINHDPTYPLFKTLRYGGLVFEGDPDYLQILRKNMQAVNYTGGIHIIEKYIRSSTLLEAMVSNKVPTSFDALKIDIDSIDFSILETILLAGYSPRLVMVEVNPDIPPPFVWSLRESDQFQFNLTSAMSGAYGMSVTAAFNLLVSNNYTLVEIEFEDLECKGCRFSEHNAWFVHNDLLVSGNSITSPPTAAYNKEEYSEKMFRMYWSRGPYEECIHLAECPLHIILGNSCPPLKASISLAGNPFVAEKILGKINQNMATLCPNCTFKSAVSEFIGGATKSDVNPCVFDNI